ncbi:MAG: leucine-rich repeat protein [Oscillospiraceae bacterium]|nr:leucine-rich repeat protein [Oscillospiraceae bacterium]
MIDKYVSMEQVQMKEGVFDYVLKENGTVKAVMREESVFEQELVVNESFNGYTVSELFIPYRTLIHANSLYVPKSVCVISEITDQELDSILKSDFSFMLGGEIQGIAVSDKNTEYCSDGFSLMTADRKRLIHFFNYRTDSYTVPDGVEIISKGAFAEATRLVTVDLPSSVHTICSKAFLKCEKLNCINGIHEGCLIESDAFAGTQFIKEQKELYLSGACVRLDAEGKKKIVVPEGITRIEDNAMSSTEKVEKIVLPSTLKWIGGNAFGKVPSLREVNIPDGVVEIPNNLFKDALSLTELYIPENVKTIGKDAFPVGNTSIQSQYYQTRNVALSSICVSEKNESYASYQGILYSKDMSILYRCPPSLTVTSLVIPDGVEMIADYAFCNNKTVTDVVLPESLKKIGRSAFLNCSVLKTINLDGIEYMGDSAFGGCINLVRADLSCEVIPKDCFRNCAMLTDVALNNTREIKEQAFENTKIAAIAFPDTLRIIESRAFYGAELENVTVPKTVEKAGESSFAYTKELTVYDNLRWWVDWAHDHDWEKYKGPGFLAASYFSQTVEELDGSIYVSKVEIPECSVTVLSAEDGSVQSEMKVYKGYGERFNAVLLNAWEENCAFHIESADNQFEKIESMEGKRDYAFWRLSHPFRLEDAHKERMGKYIARNALEAAKKCIDDDNLYMIRTCEEYGLLKKDNINVLISYAAQKERTEISAYLINYKEEHFKSRKKGSNDIDHIFEDDRWALVKKSSLISRYRGFETEVTFPVEVNGIKVTGIAQATTQIPENYLNLKAVVIPEGYESIGDRAFLGCKNLESVSLPSTLRSIGARAFEGCESLKQITIPDSVTSIGKACFKKCHDLQDVILSSGLSEIPEECFDSCFDLNLMHFPAGIRKFRKNCTDSDVVVIHNKVPEIENGAFSQYTTIYAFSDRVGNRKAKRIWLADLPSDTAVKILVTFSDETILSYTETMERQSNSIDVLREDEIVTVLSTAVTGVDLANWLQSIYGTSFMSDGDSDSDAGKFIRKCVFSQVERISVEENKKNADGTSCVSFEYRIGDSSAFIERKGVFADGSAESYQMLPKVNTAFVLSKVNKIDFTDKIFVLTGFDADKEEEIESIITGKGGSVKSSVVKATDYLVVNEYYDRQTKKYEKAAEMRESGGEIAIIDYATFRRLAFI